jgi:hypothetical protein
VSWTAQLDVLQSGQIILPGITDGRLIPVIGDVGLAAWKANSRNAHM